MAHLFTNHALHIRKYVTAACTIAAACIQAVCTQQNHHNSRHFNKNITATWLAIFQHKYYSNPKNKDRNAYLYGGWREFVEDNHLNVGDVCVFELIKLPEILMKVVINLLVENTSKACDSLAFGSIDSRVNTRSLVSDAEPTCQQSLCPSSSGESKDLTDSYIETLDDSPLDQETKKLTPRSIQPCELKYSAEDDSGRTSGAQRCLKPDPVYQKQRACIGGGAFRTSNSSFSVVIHPSYVGSCSALHIPKEFGKRYLKNSGEMMLRIEDGKTWTVEYERRARNKGRKAEFKSNSWGQFTIDNELEVGDVCVFELINENGNLLEVAFRKLYSSKLINY
uniref:TF-B3 domain-containing protein n=2 Tax=Gossypium raimondii TaxID=29730 RepID=A0A0D2TYV0_GOSRA|nr:hypothetical protein B456_008G071500 [Gossypium raimondii]